MSATAIDAPFDGLKRQLTVSHAYRLIRYYLTIGESVAVSAAHGAAFIGRAFPATTDHELVRIEAMLVGVAADEVVEMRRGLS